MKSKIGNLIVGDKGIWTVFFFLCLISVVEVFSASSTLTYKSHNYLFQGGTLDCFTEIITNAFFREYKRYDTLWDGTPPSYDQEIKYND